jgi:cytochrome c oxidase subunit II
MNSLLIIIVLVLLAIAIWQLTKIFDMTQVGNSNDNSQVASNNDNKVQGYLMFGFLIFIYLTTIFCIVKYGNLPLLSDSASEHGPIYDNLMIISLVIIFIVQIITQALLHYFAYKYSGKEGQKALYYADNNKLEFIWSSIPAIVLAGLIFYGLYAWNDIMYVDKEDEQNAIIVEVYAKQFGWTARYAGADNVLGKANVRYIEGINTLGVDMSDPNAQDDIVSSDELHLPKGKRVIFRFRSQDVLHSAYFPHFRAQMNCVPGMVTNFSFVPTVTTQEMRDNENMVAKVDNINKIRTKKSVDLVAQGKEALDPYTFDYLLLCNKICGASHYNMQMKVVVDTPQDFKNWLKGKSLLSKEIKDAALANEAEKVQVSGSSKESETIKIDTALVAKAEMN